VRENLIFNFEGRVHRRGEVCERRERGRMRDVRLGVEYSVAFRGEMFYTSGSRAVFRS
jgi:hypothetical protein